MNARSLRRQVEGPVRICPTADRRGSLLAEAAMAAVLLMVAMTLTVQVVGLVGSARRACERRQWATLEAANLMEQLTGRPFASVTPETAAAAGLSPQAFAVLPDAELNVEVTPDDPAGGAGSKRIEIRIRWRNRAGRWDAPVRLTTWIYREAQP